MRGVNCWSGVGEKIWGWNLFIGGIPFAVNGFTEGFLPGARVGDFLVKFESFEGIVTQHKSHKCKIICWVTKFKIYLKGVL